jgi:hypothetical protein
MAPANTQLEGLLAFPFKFHSSTCAQQVFDMKAPGNLALIGGSGGKAD